ncbi:hypothetical protein Tco_0559018 [Tanacetum coccineum]
MFLAPRNADDEMISKKLVVMENDSVRDVDLREKERVPENSTTKDQEVNVFHTRNNRKKNKKRSKRKKDVEELDPRKEANSTTKDEESWIHVRRRQICKRSMFFRLGTMGRKRRNGLSVKCDIATIHNTLEHEEGERLMSEEEKVSVYDFSWKGKEKFKNQTMSVEMLEPREMERVPEKPKTKDQEVNAFGACSKEKKKKNRSKRKICERRIEIAADHNTCEQEERERLISKEEKVSLSNVSWKRKEKIHQPKNGRSPMLVLKRYIDMCLDGGESSASVVSGFVVSGCDVSGSAKSDYVVCGSVASGHEMFEVDSDYQNIVCLLEIEELELFDELSVE